MIALALIRSQKEGPVNAQRLVRDSRATQWKSRPTHRQSGRPSSWALIAAKDASILAHFSQSDIGVEMGPNVGYP